MGDLPSRVPNDPRYFTADVHITPDGRARIGNHSYSPEEYGDLLRRSGWDGKTPIRLIGCDAGSNDFARRLAAHTDAPVLAPTKPAWTDGQGRVYTSDAEVDAHGNRRPRIPPNGEWETHSPDGTRTRASEDGFVPGTKDSDKSGLAPEDARDRAADDDGSSSDSNDDDTPQYDPPIVTRRVPADEPPFASWTRPDDSAFSPPPADDPALRPLARGEPFSHRQGPDADGNYGLRPNTRYEVPDRGTFFTDGEGRIAWVEADGGKSSGNFNPDLNHPLPNTEYRVNDRWTFNTNEHGETESMTGTPDYDRSHRAGRDGDAQERSAAIGRAAFTGTEFEHVRWDGGHMAANNMGGPSEYINMFPQMRASNQGHYKDGYVNSESWRRMEMDLAKLNGTQGCTVDQVQVRAERGPDGVPREVTFRWTQTVNGVTETLERTYPNVPRVNFGPQTPYPD